MTHQPTFYELEALNYFKENKKALKWFIVNLSRTTLDQLKRGIECVACGKTRKAFCKSLNKRLVEELIEAKEFLLENDRTTFKGSEVWDDHNTLSDFQKLQYFRRTENGQGLIEPARKSGFWKITWVGEQFLKGRLQLPKRVWVYRNEIWDMEDERVSVGTAEERWQEYREDYVFDYEPVSYKQLSIKL